MFKNNYDNDMNNISASEKTKADIMAKLQNVPSRKKTSKQCIFWRIGTVAVACAVAAVAIILPKKPTSIAPIQGNDIIAANTYDDVYNAIDEVYRLSVQSDRGNFFDRLFGGVKNATAEGEVYIEYSATTDNFNDGEPAKGNSKPVTTPTDDAIVEESATDENTSANSDDDHTKTNTQVDGVDEADIVKTDGKYIYSLYNSEIRIAKADKGKLEVINTLKLERLKNNVWDEMYLTKDRLCLASVSANLADTTETKVLIIDISDPRNAKQIGYCSQDGYYNDSRLIGNSLYLITNHSVNVSRIKKDDPETFVPQVNDISTEHTTSPECIRIYDCTDLEAVYTVVSGYDIQSGKLISTQSILGRCDSVYCSTKNLITTRYCGFDTETGISYSVAARFSIDKGNIEFVADGRINGSLLNQFSMDEYNGNFRFVTTVSSSSVKKQIIKSSSDEISDVAFVQSSGSTSASLYILDSNLKPLGAIEDLAKGERVYSVRFMGDTAYFVTFRQTDPLFSADLSDPKNPKILGQLKIPGFSNYLFPYGNGQLLGLGMEADEKTGATECMKLSMFDITDPANVTEHSKYLIEDSYYSPALYDHKASLIDPKRDLIGFSCSSVNSLAFRLYSCNEGFKLVHEFELNKADGYLARAIVIGDVMYLVEATRISSYSLDSFDMLHSVRF